MGALALSLVMGASALPAPLVLPASAEVEAESGDAELPTVGRYASPAEKRKAMADRRVALLRAAREQAEQTGSVSGEAKEAAKQEEEAPAAGTDLQSMLSRLSGQVGAGAKQCMCRAACAAPPPAQARLYLPVDRMNHTQQDAARCQLGSALLGEQACKAVSTLLV